MQNRFETLQSTMTLRSTMTLATLSGKRLTYIPVLGLNHRGLTCQWLSAIGNGIVHQYNPITESEMDPLEWWKFSKGRPTSYKVFVHSRNDCFLRQSLKHWWQQSHVRGQLSSQIKLRRLFFLMKSVAVFCHTLSSIKKEIQIVRRCKNVHAFIWNQSSF